MGSCQCGHPSTLMPRGKLLPPGTLGGCRFLGFPTGEEPVARVLDEAGEIEAALVDLVLRVQAQPVHLDVDEPGLAQCVGDHLHRPVPDRVREGLRRLRRVVHHHRVSRFDVWGELGGLDAQNFLHHRDVLLGLGPGNVDHAHRGPGCGALEQVQRRHLELRLVGRIFEKEGSADGVAWGRERLHRLARVRHDGCELLLLALARGLVVR
mmetsp:Transcript_13764/g.32635  ORF Transcript_13764/g.32635 Transcript_13764/m.32635 type:complete len:209 (-) Transcript_13764:629-1255(-)